jgi:SAM-dependent methyltransferase
MKTNWREFNRANWDERVKIHLAADFYDLSPLRGGRGRLTPIDEAELGPIDGIRILHLQCHFGRDSLVLAQRGASVVGVDFSGPAIAAARDLAAELGLTERAKFIETDLYETPKALPEPGSFDLVFVTWGAINWLPDIRQWADVVAYFLRPGGALYLAEGHPCALVFDDLARMPTGMPGYFVPYFLSEPLILNDSRDYADDTARLQNATIYQWMHPLGKIVTSLLEAGLTLQWLHEHDSVPWRMFDLLVRDGQGMYRWPDRPWLPLAFSLRAERPVLPLGVRIRSTDLSVSSSAGTPCYEPAP